MMVVTPKVRGNEAVKSPNDLNDRDAQADTKKLGGLVLARQLGESIMIGESVMIEILGLKTNSVRLRIVAPRSVAVHRREVYDAIRLAPRSTPENPIAVAPGDAATATATVRTETDGGLVLTRRVGQTIMIGDQVAVDIVEARAGTARLRIIAPRSIAVHRREVFDAIQSGELRGN